MSRFEAKSAARGNDCRSYNVRRDESYESDEEGSTTMSDRGVRGGKVHDERKFVFELLEEVACVGAFGEDKAALRRVFERYMHDWKSFCKYHRAYWMSH